MTQAEQRICQNCKASFIIDASDFNFYEKIKVPPPTFCPDCRLERRMALRNERVLYKDTCDLCGKAMLSMYSPDKPFTVYCKECWYSDRWDPLAYGAAYDWQKPFLRQFRELLERTPRIALASYHNNVNADYANFFSNVKNVYLAFSIVGSENIYYSRSIDKSKDCFDCFNLNNAEMCYENVDGARNYQTRFLVRSRDCINSAFLFDSVNCQNCLMSSNLRNKQFVIRNTQYTKDAYKAEVERINTGRYVELGRLKQEFLALIKTSLHKYGNLIKTTNATGDNIENSKNVVNSFDVNEGENLRFCSRIVGHSKDGYDVYGALRSELIYEGVATGVTSYDIKFFNFCDVSRSTFYTDWCHHSSNLFGCVSLRKKEYCILNKQYTKEEYETLVPKIIEHTTNMPYVDKRGRIYKYGELFPIEHSSWAYNETLAQEYFPLTKEEALAQGYGWRDPDPYSHKPTMQPKDLPDDIKDTPDLIINEIIGCSDCDRAYRIIKPELDFLRHENTALPRKCPDCRHKDRFVLRNPLKLWHRRCMCDYIVHANTAKHAHHPEGRCPNEFETSYAPERPEVVYCESCYNGEIV